MEHDRAEDLMYGEPVVDGDIAYGTNAGESNAGGEKCGSGRDSWKGAQIKALWRRMHRIAYRGASGYGTRGTPPCWRRRCAGR